MVRAPKEGVSPLMADRKMKRMFRDAAEIAKSVPAEFRETAFNRALDLLAEQERPAGRNGSAAPQTAEPEPAATRRGITGFTAPDFVIEQVLDSVNFAANRLGRETMTAEDVADIMQERFGVTTPADLVASAMNATGMVARTAGYGGQTLYRIVSRTPGRGRKKAEAANAKSAGRRSGRGKRASGNTPGEIVQDLIMLGFFASARTTADVLLYVQKQGLDLTSQQIAPVLSRLMRSGDLEAKKNKDGRYTYWAEDE